MRHVRMFELCVPIIIYDFCGALAEWVDPRTLKVLLFGKGTERILGDVAILPFPESGVEC